MTISTFFTRVWSFIRPKTLASKICLVFVFFIILFVLARCNIFGNPYYRFAKTLLPWKIPICDPDEPVVLISITFKVKDDIGKLDATYYTGDSFSLSFTVNRSCYVVLFGIDSEGIKPYFGDNLSSIDNLSSSPVNKGSHPVCNNFELNGTVGPEIYYAVAATKNFSYKKHIQKRLKKKFPKGNSKGLVSKYKLDLPKDFAQDYFYFTHE